MGLVGEGRGGSGDVQSAQRFGISNILLMNSIGQMTRSKRISDRETGETMDIVEGPKDEDVCPFTDEQYGRSSFKVCGVLKVCLVHYHGSAL